MARHLSATSLYRSVMSSFLVGVSDKRWKKGVVYVVDVLMLINVCALSCFVVYVCVLLFMFMFYSC